ncbi:MAG: cytochrome c family protein [Thermodesulfobacteriota bacterium]|nr:cytochrome c family protein [Thermodesulfobacteriota bacterium]
MKLICFIVVLLCVCLLYRGVVTAEEKSYIGSKACEECHAVEYAKFIEFAKKAASFESIRVMKSKLTDKEYRSCFECHTTGYGKPGGFVSEEKTPQLKNAGCEVCHGPGSLHAESGDPEDIIYDLSIDDCTACHNSDRVDAFDFKPLLFGGAH